MNLLDKIRLPETKNVDDLDSPTTTILHSQIIQKKYFLKNLYLEFYNIFKDTLPSSSSKLKIVELGSGGGFIKDIMPLVITSDVFDVPGLDLRFSATQIPFPDDSVDAFFMLDVFHHIPQPAKFLKEAARCLKPDGKIVMIEPANTLFGRFIYQHFHHEPFHPESGWELKSAGPLTSANGAMAWIIFVRDQKAFEQRFPSLHIEKLQCHTPFRYLLSGGLSYRQLLPNCFYSFVTKLENILKPFHSRLGMFVTIEITKKRI